MSSQAPPPAPPYERYYRVLGIGDALTGLHSQLHHLSVTLFGSTFCGRRVWNSLEWSGVLRRMQPDFTEGRAVPRPLARHARLVVAPMQQVHYRTLPRPMYCMEYASATSATTYTSMFLVHS